MILPIHCLYRSKAAVNSIFFFVGNMFVSRLQLSKYQMSTLRLICDGHLFATGIKEGAKDSLLFNPFVSEGY